MTNKTTFKMEDFVYFGLSFLCIFTSIQQFIIGDTKRGVLSLVCMCLMSLVNLIEKPLHVEIPSPCKITVMLVIFSSQILGEINNFYGIYKWFDTVLHLVFGFLFASFGFSKLKINKLSNSLIIVLTVCISISLGVMWEFFEYGMDSIFKTDMQKDVYVQNINSVKLDPNKNNDVVKLEEIDYVLVYGKNNILLQRLDPYLDIGLHDTMKDLFVNFISASIFGFIGYLYLKDKSKYRLLENFIIKKEELNNL